MAKLTLNPLLAGYRSSNSLNTNFDAIEAALENTLSRDGSAPNQMEADLDLNDNRIINLDLAVDDNDAVPLVQLTDLIGDYTADIAADLAAAEAAAAASAVSAGTASTAASTATSAAGAAAADAAAADADRIAAEAAAASVAGLFVTPDAYGAFGNSTTGLDGANDYTALQTAINTGSDVYLKPGKRYRYTTGLVMANNRQRIYGPGILSPHGAIDGITLNGATTGVSLDVTFNAPGQSSGYAVKISDANRVKIERLNIMDAYGALYVEKANVVDIDWLWASLRGPGIKWYGSAALRSDLLSVKFAIMAPGAGFYGFDWDGNCHSAEISYLGIVGGSSVSAANAKGVIVRNTSGGTAPAIGKFKHVEVDYAGGDGIDITLGSDFDVMGAYVLGASSSGLKVGATVNSREVRVTGGKFRGCSRYGIENLGGVVLYAGNSDLQSNTLGSISGNVWTEPSVVKASSYVTAASGFYTPSGQAIQFDQDVSGNYNVYKTGTSLALTTGGNFLFQTSGGNSFTVTPGASSLATFSGPVTVTGIAAATSFQAASTGGFYWASRGGVFAAADGVFSLYNNAGTDFTRLQFGGTTSSFPALKRSGTALQSRLADDSAYTSFRASGYAFTNGQYIDTAGSDGWLFSNSAGTSYGYIYADAANTLAQRNSTNAQTFRVYNTFTDISNSEWGVSGWATNVYYIGSQKIGTGQSRAVQFLMGSTSIFQINTSGHFIWNTDNTYDIGASGANRPKDLHLAGNARFGGFSSTTGAVYTGGSGAQAVLYGVSDGVLRLTNSGLTDFSRLQFGGTTSSFPALKRSGAGLDARLADDSGYTSVRASLFWLTNGSYVNDLADGVISLRNSTGTDFNRLTFGGSSSSFPALKRSGTGVDFRLADDSGLTFIGASSLILNGQATLTADASHIGALRSGTNAQTFRVYETYTDASNYSRLSSGFASAAFEIRAEAAGTGSVRNLRLATSGAAAVIFATSGSDRWYVSSAGHFLTNADNTYDIGASGANRPRHLYLGGNLAIAGTSTLSDTLTVQKNQNALTQLVVANITAGTTARTGFTLNSDTGALVADSFSSLYTPSGGGDDVANGARLYSTGVGGLSLRATHASGTLRFYTGATERGRFDASGYFGIGVTPDSKFHVDLPGVASVRIGYTGTSLNYYDANNHSFRSGAGTQGLVITPATSTLSFGGSSDVVLTRDAAGTLAQRNGANAQAFNIYNTYTDASNYERGSIGWNSNYFDITAPSAGTGVARGMRIYAGATASLGLGAGGNVHWNIGATGHLTTQADNTYDIGASGATRPRNVYAGTNIVAGAQITAGSNFICGPSNGFIFSGRSILASPANGNIRLTNQAETDFSLLQFGGVTSAFPALKRSGANLHVRNADDTAFTEVHASALSLDTNTATIALGASSDVLLYRDASDILALRRATTAQFFRVYNTYTDASNSERLAIGWNANTCFVATENAGTGSTRNMVIRAGNQLDLSGSSGSNGQWNLLSSGTLRPGTDNTFDLGQSAVRVRSGYFSTSLVVASSTITADAANSLALRNGTTAQRLSVYNTYTDASNYERAAITYNASVLEFGHEYLGTGVARDVRIKAPGAASLFLSTNGTDAVTVLSTGRVGINNASPATRLDVGGTVTATAFSTTGNYIGTGTGYVQAAGGFYVDANFYLVLNGSSNPTIAYEANTTRGYDRATDTEVLTINSVAVTSTSGTAVTNTVPVITPVYTVATLPAGTNYMRAFVSDASGPTFGAAVVGGGAVKVPVYYDGGWKVG